MSRRTHAKSRLHRGDPHDGGKLDKPGYHVVALEDHEVTKESSPVVAAIIRTWLKSLVMSADADVATICPTCDEAVNGDIGGFIVIEPTPGRPGAVVGLCTRCFASDEVRERATRQLQRARDAATN